MNRFSTFKSAGLIFALLLLAGCTQNQTKQAYGGAVPELPVEIVKQDTAILTQTYAASIEGVTNVEIRPQVSGYLEKILIDEGAYVKAGQVLFQIENSVYREQYNNSLANLTTAKIDLDRKKELLKSKIVSDLQVQQAEAIYKGALSQAELSKINLNFCTIKAPVSGYISRIPFRLGSLITPTSQDPLTFLTDISKINAYFSLSEADYIRFQNQYDGNTLEQKLTNIAAVKLLIADGQEYELPGKIDAIDGQFNKTTGSITLRAKFDNPKSLLRSGNTGKIVITQKYNDVILIPIASTLFMQDKVFVFSVDKQSNAVQLPIEVAGKSGNNYIVSGGIKAGDTYIISGFERLQPGSPIIQKTTAQNFKTTK